MSRKPSPRCAAVDEDRSGYECLIYRPRGWAIERETYANELMEYINMWLASSASTPDIGWLNNKNREVLFLLLDHIEASQNPKYLPALEVWASDTSRRLARRIHAVIKALPHS